MTSRGKVLVVEDEWFIAEDYERVLRKAGYEVAGPVPNVQAAMRLVEKGGIDAALLDVAIGNEKSFPIAERLRTDGVPFAFLTGYSGDEIPEPFKSAALIGKPAPPATLLAVVSQMLSTP